MALITCDECRREISDRAPACPHCGNPLRAARAPLAVETRAGAVVTTQATDRELKKGLLASGAIFLFGFVLLMIPGIDWYWPFWCILFGLLLHLFIRWKIWWRHG